MAPAGGDGMAPGGGDGIAPGGGGGIAPGGGGGGMGGGALPGKDGGPPLGSSDTVLPPLVGHDHLRDTHQEARHSTAPPAAHADESPRAASERPSAAT
jgi:hypothetical protein